MTLFQWESKIISVSYKLRKHKMTWNMYQNQVLYNQEPQESSGRSLLRITIILDLIGT